MAREMGIEHTLFWRDAVTKEQRIRGRWERRFGKYLDEVDRLTLPPRPATVPTGYHMYDRIEQVSDQMGCPVHCFLPERYYRPYRTFAGHPRKPLEQPCYSRPQICTRTDYTNKGVSHYGDHRDEPLEQRLRPDDITRADYEYYHKMRAKREAARMSDYQDYRAMEEEGVPEPNGIGRIDSNNTYFRETLQVRPEKPAPGHRRLARHYGCFPFEDTSRANAMNPCGYKNCGCHKKFLPLDSIHRNREVYAQRPGKKKPAIQTHNYRRYRDTCGGAFASPRDPIDYGFTNVRGQPMVNNWCCMQQGVENGYREYKKPFVPHY